jgi:hypothetical protein
LHRCTFVPADEFQFGFLLLTSNLYFQLGSGSGLDVIKYSTCSNTCPLAVILKDLLLLMRQLRLLPILTLLSFSAEGQVTDTAKVREIIVKRSVGLLTGITFGKNTFIDIGISKNSNTVVGHHPFSSAYFASTELKFGDKFIIGPKIGAWAAGGVSGMAIGLNMIYYTDFDNASLVFRPEIGFAFQSFKIVYGYNAILTRHKLEGVNRNLGSVIYCFRIKKLSDKIRR